MHACSYVAFNALSKKWVSSVVCTGTLDSFPCENALLLPRTRYNMKLFCLLIWKVAYEPAQYSGLKQN